MAIAPTNFFEYLEHHYSDALDAAIKAAAADTDTNPTEDQKRAGNYRKGRVTINGLPISIENPRGSIRRGVGSDGKTWQVRMAHHYGYIRRTESEADGDHVDVFIGPDPKSQIVFVVDQLKEDGRFDEHKCLIGFTNEADAKKGYLANYSPGWKGFGAIKAMTMDDFKRWLDHGDTSMPAAGQRQYAQSHIPGFFLTLP